MKIKLQEEVEIDFDEKELRELREATLAQSAPEVCLIMEVLFDLAELGLACHKHGITKESAADAVVRDAASPKFSLTAGEINQSDRYVIIKV